MNSKPNKLKITFDIDPEELNTKIDKQSQNEVNQFNLINPKSEEKLNDIQSQSQIPNNPNNKPESQIHPEKEKILKLNDQNIKDLLLYTEGENYKQDLSYHW